MSSVEPKSPLAEPQASRRAVAEIELAALLRPEIEELRAYVPEVPPGIRVKLDANEAPPSASLLVREVVGRAVASVAHVWPKMRLAITMPYGYPENDGFPGSQSPNEVFVHLIPGLTFAYPSKNE